MKRFLLIIGILVFLVWFAIISKANAQVVLFSEGAVFEKGMHYDNNQTLDYIYSERLKWDDWVADGYIGKFGAWYYVTFPIWEKWEDGIVCHLATHKDLKWFNDRKYFGWDIDDPVEPVEVHYREFRFRLKKGNIVEKEKGRLLKNESNGHQDLKDTVYKGLKGTTLAFEKRNKPKGKVMK